MTLHVHQDIISSKLIDMKIEYIKSQLSDPKFLKDLGAVAISVSASRGACLSHALGID